MAEGIKIGGVYLDVSANEEDVLQAFDNILAKIRSNSNQAESVYKSELKNIENVIKSVQAKINQSTDSSTKGVLTNYVNMLDNLKKQIKSAYTEISAYNIEPDFKSMSDEAKRKLSREMAEVGKQATKASSSKDLVDTEGEAVNTKLNVEERRLVKERAEIESKIADLKRKDQSDSVRGSLEVLKTQQRQLDLQEKRIKNERIALQATLESRRESLKLELERTKVDRGILVNRDKLKSNPNDVEANKNLNILESKRAELEIARTQHDEAVRTYKTVLKLNADILDAKMKELQLEERIGRERVDNAVKAERKAQSESESKVKKTYVKDVDDAHSQALKEEAKRNQQYMDRLHEEALREYNAYRQREYNIDRAHYQALQENARRHQQQIDRIHQEALRENTRRNRQEQANNRAIQERNRLMGESVNSIRGVNVAVQGMLAYLGGKTLYEWLLGQPAEFQRTVNQFGLLIGDLGRASEAVDKFKAIAFSSPYNLIDITNAANSLAGTDLYVTSIEDLTERLATLARGNADILKQITKATSDVINAGKLQGQELLQLKNSGIPIVAEIARNLNISNAEFKNLQEAGEITVDIYLEAIRTLTSEGGKYYGLLEQMSEDYLGRLEQVKGKFIELGIEIGGRGMDRLTTYFEELEEKLGSEDYKKLANEWADAFDKLMETAIKVIDYIANNPDLITWFAKMAGGALVVGTVTTALGVLLKSIAPLVLSLRSLTVASGTASASLVGLGAVSTLTAPQIMGIALACWAVFEVSKALPKVIATATGHFHDFNKEISKKESADQAIKNLKDIEDSAKQLGMTVEEYKEHMYMLYGVDGLVVMQDSFEKSAEALREVGIELNNLQPTLTKTLSIIPEKLESLLELSKVQFLSEDQEMELLDILSLTNRIHNIGPYELFDAEGVLRAEQVKRYIADIPKSIEAMDEVSLIVAFEPKLEPLRGFIDEYSDEIDKVSQETGELTYSKLNKVFNGRLKKSVYNSLKDYFDDANVEFTAENFVSYFSKVEDSTKEFKRVMIEQMGEVEDSVRRVEESWARGAQRITNEINSFKLKVNNDPVEVMNLDTESLVKELAYVKRLVEEVNNTPIQLFNVDKIDTAFTQGLVESAKVWQYFGDEVTSVVGQISEGLTNHTIDLQTINHNRGMLEQELEALYLKRLDLLQKNNKTSKEEIDKEIKIYEEQKNALNSIFANIDSDLDKYGKNVLFVAKQKGLATSEQIGSIFGGFVKARKSQNEQLKEEIDDFFKDAEKSKTADQLASEAYGVLTRQLDVEMVTIQQYRKKAQEIRNKYFQAGTLEYLEYSKKIEGAVEAHNKRLEELEKERREKQKESLEKQLKLSDRFIEEMSYKQTSGNTPFFDAYSRVQKREYDAYKRGIKTYEEYQETMEQIGDKAYESRLKQHELYIKNQTRNNTWSYQEQISYYDKMAKEITEAYRKGLINFVRYNEELERITDSKYDIRYKQIEKLMNAHMQSVRGKYSAEVKEINDAYDKLNREKDDKKREERLKELMKLESDYANAVSKEGKDRLKSIREEIETINNEIERQKLDDERQSALSKLEDQMSQFESAFELSMETIGSSANSVAKDVGKAVEEMVKSFGKLSEFDWSSPYTSKGGSTEPTKITITNNNTVNVKNTSQAVAVGRQIKDFTAADQMAKAVKK